MQPSNTTPVADPGSAPAAQRPSIQTGTDALASAFPQHQLSLSSRAMHADDYINNHRDVAPALHVSTTFRYSDDPAQLLSLQNQDPNAPHDSHTYSRFTAPHDSHTYSRYTAPNSTRLEAVLSSVLGAPSLTYSSGLAAFHALLVMLNPRRIAIGEGYHGCHGVIRLMARLTGLEQLTLAPADLDRLQPGDVLHVETPLNPTGEARDLEHYAAIARARGAALTVDATFAPPPLLDPFALGADIVLHSGTKYFGGHSDMLCGVLAVSPHRAAAPDAWVDRLHLDRLFLGSVVGSLEGWLGVRSLRTLELRVERQSRSAQDLVSWLAAEAAGDASTSPIAKILAKVQHASLQPEAADETSWLRRQMPRGFGPVFSIILNSEHHARSLPSKLHLFHHATSLGGVESLIEWRAMSDPNVDKALLRISVGIESPEDLKADLIQAFQALIADDDVAATKDSHK